MTNLNGVTAKSFCEFQVSDSTARCCSCATIPTPKLAPIVIADKHYCLWCALEIARKLLGRVNP